MAEPKTKKNNASVRDFLNGIEEEQKRKDCKKISAMMKKAVGASPKMWGDAIVGFGSYRYKSASGREGDWMLVGFSPRKANISLYLMAGFEKTEESIEEAWQT